MSIQKGHLGLYSDPSDFQFRSGYSSNLEVRNSIDTSADELLKGRTHGHVAVRGHLDDRPYYYSVRSIFLGYTYFLLEMSA